MSTASVPRPVGREEAGQSLADIKIVRKVGPGTGSEDQHFDAPDVGLLLDVVGEHWRQNLLADQVANELEGWADVLRLVGHGLRDEAPVDPVAALYAMADAIADLSRRARALRHAAPDEEDVVRRYWQIEHRDQVGGA